MDPRCSTLCVPTTLHTPPVLKSDRMVSTSDFNWTLPHGRMQFCHMVTYDPDPELPCNVVGCQRFDPEIGPTQMGGLGTSRPLLARKES